MGKASGSSSTSSSNSTTQNTDKRLVVSDYGLGISSDTSTVTVNATDNGAVKDALNYADKADARQGQTLDSVIGLAGALFSGGFEALKTSQSQVNAAYLQATETKQAAGTIDNRTIMVLGIASAAAVAYMARAK